MKKNRKDYIRMDANENPYGCSPKVIETLAELKEEVSVYPDDSGLIEKIAGYAGCNPENIAVSNGSDDLIRNLIGITLERLDKVVLPVPTFSMNRIYLDRRKARIAEIKLTSGALFPFEEVIKTAQDTSAKLVMLVNPSVPYGDLIDRAVIEKIIKDLPETTILVDEAYGEFSGTSVADLVDRYENLVVLKTFSKAFGLAGARVGYSISSKKLAQRISSSLSPYSVSSISLKLAQTAIEDKEWMLSKLEKIKESSQKLFKGLKELGLNPESSCANYITFLSPNSEKICLYLKSQGILVRYFKKGEGLPEQAVRISVGTEKENALVLKKLSGFLKPEVIIFDMDGVLVDVSNSYIEAIRQTYRKFAKTEVSDEQIRELRLSGGFNNDWELTFKLLRQNDVAVSYDNVVKSFQRFYLGTNCNGLIDEEKLIIEKEVLKKLSKKYKLAIFTGRPRKEAEYVLNRFGISDYFQSVVTMDDVKAQKPDSEGVVKTLKNLGAETAVYLGDTVDDMKCAGRSNCVGVGVNETADELRTRALINAGASFVLSDVNEIGGLL